MIPYIKRLVGSFALALLVPLGAQGEVPLIPREQAIKRADAKMLRMGYELSEMYPVIDEDNKKWNEFVKGHLRTDLPPDRDPGPDVRGAFERQYAKVRGKQFWNIAYKWKPKDGRQVIGGVVIFVDANNGDILLAIEHPCAEECETRPLNKR